MARSKARVCVLHRQDPREHPFCKENGQIANGTKKFYSISFIKCPVSFRKRFDMPQKSRMLGNHTLKSKALRMVENGFNAAQAQHFGRAVVMDIH